MIADGTDREPRRGVFTRTPKVFGGGLSPTSANQTNPRAAGLTTKGAKSTKAGVPNERATSPRPSLPQSGTERECQGHLSRVLPNAATPYPPPGVFFADWLPNPATIQLPQR